MDRLIHKITMSQAPRLKIAELEAGTKFIHVAEQHETIAIWFERGDGPLEKRYLWYVLTGDLVPPGATYLGTALLDHGCMVVHVYEVPATREEER